MDVLEVLNLLFFVFMLAGAPVFAALIVLFNRRFTISSLESRKRWFKMGYTETEVKIGRVFAVVVGTFLLIGSLMNTAKYLLP